MRALIVDDSSFIRDYIRSLLEYRGTVCIDAGNGREGLNCLYQRDPYDVLLVDWNMPVMGGLEMVRAVRANRQFDAMKIVMVTTEAEEGFIEAALAAGADEYLMKPFDAMGLSNKLQMVGLAEG
jgi:two-component system chemotaxis response regulator CheY